MTVTLDPISAYWTLSPNWINSVFVSHIWRTSILLSITGEEQRSQHFSWVRRKVRFSVDSLNFTESAWVQRNLNRHIHEIWGIPIWPDGTEITSALIGGETSIPTDSLDHGHWSDGCSTIIIHKDNFQVYEELIQTSIAGGLTLSTPVVGAYPVGSTVYPLLRTKLGSTMEVRTYTDDKGRIEVEALGEGYFGVSDGA